MKKENSMAKDMNHGGLNLKDLQKRLQKPVVKKFEIGLKGIIPEIKATYRSGLDSDEAIDAFKNFVSDAKNFDPLAEGARDSFIRLDNTAIALRSDTRLHKKHADMLCAFVESVLALLFAKYCVLKFRPYGYEAVLSDFVNGIDDETALDLLDDFKAWLEGEEDFTRMTRLKEKFDFEDGRGEELRKKELGALEEIFLLLASAAEADQKLEEAFAS
jgi:hypothetical protein